jgi:hypothetical protein
MKSPVVLINREMGSNLWRMRPPVSLAAEGHLTCSISTVGGKREENN